jgi:CRISPR-associated protein Csm5
MNSFLNKTRCTISTLSPVHIGCGEDYYPTNYVIDDGLLHCFSEEGFLASLNPSERKNLINLTNQIDEEGIKMLQRLIYSKKDQLKNYASHQVVVSKEFEKFYLSRIKGEDRNKLEIARHAFNPYSQMPYFPGSSIKGAIRTALLNAENNKKPLNEKLSENYPAKTSNRQLQEDVLKYKGIPSDPLRLLKVSDAIYQHADSLHGLEIRFAVNRKNKKSKFQAKGPAQILECLSANRSRSLAFDINFLADKELHYRWNIQQIAKACNDFFKKQLENELSKTLEELNYSNSTWISGLQNLLTGELGEALNKQQAFLLRIGQHGGAESNTLEGLRHIKVKIKDKPAEYKYLPKPNTIWLAANHKDQQHDLLPFGWVLVEIGDFKLEKTAAFLKSHAAKDYELLEKLQLLDQQRTEVLAGNSVWKKPPKPLKLHKWRL